MAKRIFALAAALALVLTLTACGGKGSANSGTKPDTTPNGSAVTQPDTSGTDMPGDGMNGGHNATGGAVPGDGPESVGGGKARARRSSEEAAFDSEYRQMLRNGRVTDTDGFLDNDF